MSLLVKDARQVVVVCTQMQKFLKSQDIAQQFVVLENTSIAIDQSGIITHIGPLQDIISTTPETHFDKVIDASNKCIIPNGDIIWRFNRR